jgi:hypothetical protein
MKEWIRDTVIYGTGFLILCAFLVARPTNATDARRLDRSGMSLHTDHETGCQYLSALLGGITPRLAPDGSHMGCRRD